MGKKKNRKKAYNAGKVRYIHNSSFTQSKLQSICNISEPHEYRKSLIALMKEQYILPSKQEFISNLKRYKKVIQHTSIDNGIITIIEILLSIKEKLRFFINLKERVESNILLGNFEEANQLLDEVYKRYGVSYWYLECRFGVLNSLGKNSEILSIYKQGMPYIDEVVNRDYKILMEKALDESSTDRIKFIINSIVENIDRGTIDAETVRFIFNFNPSEDYELSKIINYCFNLNFPDMYIILSRALRYHRAAGYDSLLDYAKELYEVSGDKKLLNLINFQEDELYCSQYNRVLVSYYQENFNEVIKVTQKKLALDPSYAPYYDFVAKSIYHQNIKSKEGVTLYEFINSCNTLLTKSGPKKLENANQILFKHNCIDCFQYFNLVVLKSRYSFNDPRIERLHLYLYFISSAEIQDINVRTERTELIKHIQKDASLIIPEYRKKKWEMKALYSSSEHQRVLQLYHNFEFPEVVKDEMFEIYILSMSKSVELSDIIPILVNAYMNNQANIKSDILHEVNELFESCENIDMSDINTVIFVHLLHKHEFLGAQIVSLYCDAYLKLNAVDGAEKIGDPCDKERFMLEHILVVDVIKRQTVKTDKDSEIVRTKLLYKLKLIGEVDTSVNVEIEYLRNQYARKKCVKKLGKGELKVDIDLMKVNIMREFESDYIKLVETINKERILINEDYLSNEFKPLLSHKYANELLLKVRTLYTIDDILGVENSLNTDFRHNHIVEVLRAPFEKYSVICNTSNGSYLNNKFIEEHYRMSILDEFYRRAQNSVKEFSENVDNLLFLFKNNHLHICTNDFEESEKLFKYEVNKHDVYKFLEMVKVNPSFDTSVDWILEFYTTKTKNALEDGKILIKTEICSNLLRLVEQLKGQLLPIFPKEKNCKFMQNLANVEDDVYFATQSTSEWFDFSKNLGENFPIIVPIEEAKEFILKTNGYKDIQLVTNKLDTKLLGGKYLKTYIRIFILLFQNAVASCDSKCKLSVDIKVIDNKYKITIENNYDIIDIGKVNYIKKCLIEDNFIDGAGKDSGSGIFKVKKLIEFGLQSKSDIELNFDEISKKFTVTCLFFNNTNLVGS